MTPLLILLLPILGQACVLERDVDYSGHDLLSRHVRSEGHCAEECYGNIRCDYWTFRWTDNKCWLKHGKNGGNPHGQVVSGDKACGAVCSESEPEYDTDYPESDIVNRDGIASNDQDACADMCSNNNNCKYWTFSPGTKRCWLKNDKGRDQYRVHPRDDRVSGKRKCPAGCFREDKIDYPRGDIFGRKPMMVTNEDACSKMCLDETSCNFWSYSPSQRFCWLKHTEGDNGFIHGDADRISGNKACGSKTFVRAGMGKLCEGTINARDITLEATCRTAAAEFGLTFNVPGTWNGPTEQPGCLFDEGDRKEAFFNTSPGRPNSANPNYDSICEVA